MISEKVRACDIFGTTFNLKPIFRAERYTSILAGCFSLIAGIFITGISTIFFRKLFETENPLALVNCLKVERPPDILFADYVGGLGFLLMIAISFVDFKDYSKYVTLRNEIQMTTRAQNGTITTKRKSLTTAYVNSTSRIHVLTILRV